MCCGGFLFVCDLRDIYSQESGWTFRLVWTG